MSTSARVGVLVTLLFIAFAATSTFVPAHYRGSSCQTWFNPGWDQARVDTTYDYIDATNQLSQLEGEGTLPAEVSAGFYQRADDTLAACSSKLGTRKLVTLGALVVAAAAVPAATFVGGGSRRRVDA